MLHQFHWTLSTQGLTVYQNVFEHISPDANLFSADKRVVKLPVKSATSSTVYSNGYLLEFSYDEKANTFFHAKDNKMGWAKYEIKKSYVRVVRLQNRPDCCRKCTQCDFCWNLTQVFYSQKSTQCFETEAWRQSRLIEGMV